MKSFHTASSMHGTRNKSGGNQPKHRSLEPRQTYFSVLAAIHKCDVFFRVQLTSVSQYNNEPIRMIASAREPKEGTGETHFCRLQRDMKNIYHLSTCLHWPVAKSGWLSLPIPQIEGSLCLFTTHFPVVLMTSHMSSLLFTPI